VDKEAVMSFQFVVRGTVNSLIVRETAKGTQMLTVGVRFAEGKAGVAWPTAWENQFTVVGEVPADGKPAAVTIDGVTVKVGSEVAVSGKVGAYEKDGRVQRSFNLTAVAVQGAVLADAQF